MTSYRNAIRCAVFTALSLVLASCGVGVGGSGTGEQSAPEAFGATSASVCASPIAGALECAPAVITSPGVPPAGGTKALVYADQTNGRRVVANFDGNRLNLEAVCLGVRFAGSWGVNAAGEGRFYGTLNTRGVSVSVLATLAVQSAEAGVLSFTLQDTAGGVVLGPLALRRVDSATPDPAACP